jgi:hypothetical protein
MNFIALVYFLAKQLHTIGVVPDLSFSSVVRDSQKKLKFLRKSEKGT